MMKSRIAFFVLLMIALVSTSSVFAQTTEFVYQGQLQNGGVPATGNFDFEFLLYDALSGGTQVGATLTKSSVAVANGIFSTKLDFGLNFPGANRFLEIHVRATGGGAFTPLAPRQQISSTPYSVKSLNADTATNAATATSAVNATNATNFTGNLTGDVTGTQGATTVARLRGTNVSSTAPLNDQVLKFNSVSNQWLPGTDNTAAGGGGVTTVTASGPLASSGGATPNISLGLVPTANIADAAVTDGKINTVSGAKVTGAVANATNATTATTAVSFSGPLAGDVTGTQTATAIATDAVTTAKLADNSVTNAKIVDVAGSKITGLITAATIPGASVTGAVANATNAVNATTARTATNATQLGGVAAAQYVVTTDPRMTDARTPIAGSANYIQNQNAGAQATSNFNISGNGTTGGTLSGNVVNSAAQYNIDGNHVLSIGNPNDDNIFAGVEAGQNNVVGSGSGNAFFGKGSGRLNTDGGGNAFFGWRSGRNVTSGSNNSFFGFQSGHQTNTGTYNTSIGSQSYVSSATNGTAIGAFAVAAQNNSLVLGSINGLNFATADTNVGIGTVAPTEKLHVAAGNIRWSNSILQNSQGGSIELGGTNATAGTGIPFIDFHFNGILEDFNVRLINDLPDTLTLDGGTFRFPILATAGTDHLCRDATNRVASCSSSLRYKQNVNPFAPGLSLIKRLRPVSFNWKTNDRADMGLVAEEVAAIEPLLVTYNSKGEVEGVKYDRVGVVLINAVKEQQAQIESQQTQIDAQQKQIELLRKQNELLTMAVCSMNPKAVVCWKK